MWFSSNVLMPNNGFILAQYKNGLELQGGLCDSQPTHFDNILSFHNYIRSVRSQRRKRNKGFQSVLRCSSNQRLQVVLKCCTTDGSQGDISDEEDDETCPVDCVKEFKSDKEFFGILENAKKTKSLVVVDFYRTACGSCKYIEQGFVKLCKGSGDQENAVVFLKHNVIDEYDEQSEVAERLRIKTVPLFQFYKDGVLLEAFATRDKERIFSAINKYM